MHFACRKSASCTHVSALLHALSGLTSSKCRPLPIDSSDDEEESLLPITSQLCKWKVPKKRKDSNIAMSEAVFQKHDYSKPAKKKMKPLESFDPRPLEYRGTTASRLPTLLKNVQGQQLCISLLFDAECWQQDVNDDGDDPSSRNTVSCDCHMPTLNALKSTISAFKESLYVSEDDIREIEQNTRDQRLSPLWHSARRFRITASNFGSVMSRRHDTPPDCLVLQLVQPKKFSSPAIQYGIDNEPIALAEYVAYHHACGNTDLTTSPSGFIISLSHPFLGASPDGVVYDPSNIQQPFGVFEIKCPYTARDLPPSEACTTTGFCCTVDSNTGYLRLKENHRYYCQVQGQMAIACRPWCDFIIYTKRGINVERINFNESFWKDILLPKLISFYDNCVAPEIVSPLHTLNMPMRNLAKL